MRLSNEILQMVANRFRILADPVRLRILQDLGDEERNVQEIVVLVKSTQPNVSKHLRLMHEAGLVARRQEKNCAYYRVADPSVFLLCETVCGSIADSARKHAAALSVL